METARRVLGIGGSTMVAAAILGGCIGAPALGLVGEPLESFPPYGEIGPQEAVGVIHTLRNDPGFVLLDIRTPEEVASGHLPGAVNIDFRSPTFGADAGRLDREAIYLIYCRTANRTGQAFEMMLEMGFTKVYDLQGGISQWGELGYPICEGALGTDHVCVGEYPAPSEEI